MRMRTATVIDGRIDLEDEPLRDGTVVTILLPDARETFRLGPDAERDLLAAIAEVERGEVVSGEELLREIERG